MRARRLLLAVALWCVTSPFAAAQGGCLDHVIVIDDTGTMWSALADLQAGHAGILDTALALSGGDLRVGLVTFKDTVQVDGPLTFDRGKVAALIGALAPGGGEGEPEASDEALRTVIDGLPASARPPGMQSGDFNAFRAGCTRVISLVTDARPGGFDDAFTEGVDDVNAGLRADEAAAAGLVIDGIHVPTFNQEEVEAILRGYADATGGTYLRTGSGGPGTAAAIEEALAVAYDALGACCAAATCSAATEGDCALAGGRFQGAGSACGGGPPEIDGDGDGLSPCAGDCDDGDAGIWSTPGEAAGLALSHDRPSGVTTLAWSAPLAPGAISPRYDVLRSDGVDFTAAECLESDDGADREAADALDPAAGAVRLFLVRAENDCVPGAGPLGRGSDGLPRPGRACP